MSRDQLFGAVICAVSAVGIVVYGWLLYAFPLAVLQITAFLAVALVLVIMTWIGWTMATTPPPAPLELSSPVETKEEPAAPQT